MSLFVGTLRVYLPKLAHGRLDLLVLSTNYLRTDFFIHVLYYQPGTVFYKAKCLNPGENISNLIGDVISTTMRMVDEQS